MKLSAGNEGEEKENGITNETVGDLCVCVCMGVHRRRAARSWLLRYSTLKFCDSTWMPRRGVLCSADGMHAPGRAARGVAILAHRRTGHAPQPRRALNETRLECPFRYFTAALAAFLTDPGRPIAGSVGKRITIRRGKETTFIFFGKHQFFIRGLAV